MDNLEWSNSKRIQHKEPKGTNKKGQLYFFGSSWEKTWRKLKRK
jgi:hypothetical protein